MKKALFTFLLGTLIFLLVVATASANELPMIDDVLRDLDTAADRVEVGDDLSMYRLGNTRLTDYGGFRVIILERKNPEKEFTARRYEPPFTGEEGFPDDYEGVDRGEARVWIRCDLMKQLPVFVRASSMEEAGLLVIAENNYEMAGNIRVTNYKNKSDFVLPDFETVDEMEAFLADHQPTVSSITYYPKFDVYDILILYKIGTTESNLWDYQRTKVKHFARKPEAAFLWNDMKELDHAAALIGAGALQSEETEKLIKDLSFVPQDKQSLWLACIAAGESQTTVYSMEEYFWSMAGSLRSLDPSVEDQAKYDMIIDARDKRALALFVNYRDYSGFDQLIESIESSGEYMAAPDDTWRENALNELVSFINSVVERVRE